MIKLDPKSMEDVMVSCYNGFNRKACIVFSTYNRMHDFATSLHARQQEGLIPATHYNSWVNEIFFDTGGSIKMIDTSNIASFACQEFHTVLYDPDITDHNILAYLESLERPLRSKRRNSEMEIDSQPLDDFLNGFSVIKT